MSKPIGSCSELDTREMVKDEAWEFMFVLGISRLRGAVQMIINPTAIR